jgi:uncharacterized protein YlxW (UPF0749 family)
MRSLENIDEETSKMATVMRVKWASITRQTDIFNAAVKQKREEEGEDDESEIRAAVRRSLNSTQKQVTDLNYRRASLIRTIWDWGMFGVVNFRSDRVLQNTRRGGRGGIGDSRALSSEGHN